ncbi:hypothetical protein CERSUDRAFT_65561 [Gelatoporia subvermispora B]|uniref:F-box domain-containing protein n=1 Tax=Ceriporiopsis subvermispora (strain B) TaxID=914234 RepID=M2RD63_CERS8|nr:hypothetical protein CERSUDRAFT_65561 [Gelatoporia subvermispora B]
MAQFQDLPVELLPLVFQHVLRPDHFASLCLVNKTFYEHAVPRLYGRVYIYAWHRDGKTKVLKLFETFANYPQLASYVQKLGIPLLIRDFPKAQWGSAHENVLDHCLNGLRNCINLQSCAWTRDGSLTSEILETLVDFPHLSALDFNGRDGWDYDHRILPRFTHLQHLSIIMPSSRVVGILPSWLGATGATLKHLTLICKTSTLVTDSMLSRISPHLPNLEQLHLIGCPRVSHDGILAILLASSRGINTLGLDGVSSTLDLAELTRRTSESGALSSLRSLSLSRSLADLPSLVPLLAATQLTHLYLSISGVLSSAQSTHPPTASGTTRDRIDDPARLSASALSHFVQTCIDTHGTKLVRFALSGIGIDVRDVRALCVACTMLEDLWITLRAPSDIDAIGPCLSDAHRLRTVHLQFGDFTRYSMASSTSPSTSRSPSPVGHIDQTEETHATAPSVLAYLAPANALSLVKQCPTTLVQFGVNTRVERCTKRNAFGKVDVDVRLGFLESPEIPEQFQVVRT